MWGTGILNGLRITMRNMWRGPITVQYPFEKIDMYERSRHAVEMIPGDDGGHKCTACGNCVRVCPDYILDLQVTTAEDKSKHIDSFTYEIGACMMCGLCVEACPFSALRMGKDYELAVTDVDELVRQLIEDSPAVSPKRERAERPAPAPKPEPEAADTAKPAEEPPADDASVSSAEEPPAATADASVDTPEEAEDA